MVDETEEEIFTDRNRQTIKTIQVLQLQKDFPNCRDYYGLMRKVKGTKDCWGILKYMRMLFPKHRLCQVLNDDSIADSSGKAVFPSLGMGVKKQSNTAPRKNIEDQLCPKTLSIQENKHGDKRSREILLQIEKMYVYLLIIEENDIRLSVLKYGNSVDLDLRKDAQQMVEKTIDNKQALLDLLTIDKGKMVICRLAAVIEHSVAVKLLTFILPTIPRYWRNMTREKLTRAYNSLKFCVLQADEEDMTLILESLLDSVILDMVSNLLGVSLLMVILYRGEILYEQVKNDEGDFEKLWIDKCATIIQIMSALGSALATPVEMFSTFTSVTESPDHYLGEELQDRFAQIIKTILNEPDGGCLIVTDDDEARKSDEPV